MAVLGRETVFIVKQHAGCPEGVRELQTLPSWTVYSFKELYPAIASVFVEYNQVVIDFLSVTGVVVNRKEFEELM